MTLETKDELLTYYATPGPMTDPGPHSDLLYQLPGSLSDLVQIVQTNLIHVFWAERYGRPLQEAEKATLNIRPVMEKLDCIRLVNPAPLNEPRPLEQRQVGNCRDFSLVLSTLLRHQGVPARARCGFAIYFLPDHNEDHWVCEVWDRPTRRWVMVDAQLDGFQRQALQIGFDPLDMPRGQFIPAGEAYQMCRAGRADPNSFGIFEMHGLEFIQGNVVRDFLALNKVEILPWDWGWGYLTETAFANLKLFDHLAALLTDESGAFNELRSLFNNDPALTPPLNNLS